MFDKIIRLLIHFGWLRDAGCFAQFMNYSEFDVMFKQYFLESENMILRSDFST